MARNGKAQGSNVLVFCVNLKLLENISFTLKSRFYVIYSPTCEEQSFGGGGGGGCDAKSRCSSQVVTLHRFSYDYHSYE